MKKLIQLIPFLLLLLLSACHKPEISTYTNLSPVAYTNEMSSPPFIIRIPAGASGALYAVNTYYVDSPVSNGYACAWFISDTNTKNAGVVTAGRDTLSRYYYFDTFVSVIPYYLSDSILYNQAEAIFPSNSVAWHIQGDTTTGVPAFNNTDNTPFPVLNGFSLPKTISLNTSLNIHYTITGAYDAIFYELNRYDVVIGIYRSQAYIGGSDTSASFSPSELKQLDDPSGNPIMVRVMLAKLTPYTIGSQTFYFVKISVYSAVSTVQ